MFHFSNLYFWVKHGNVMSHINFEPNIMVEGWSPSFTFGRSQDQISACRLVVLTDIILT
jgi:hypothetical protein